MEFYEKEMGAIELGRWSNPEGCVHVAKMGTGGAVFHIREEVRRAPEAVKATTLLIGLFVADPHTLVAQAERAGARVSSAVQDYDYGYRRELSLILLAISGSFRKK